MTGVIQYSIDGGVATVILSNPPARNALDPQMARQLYEALERAGREARVVVVSGEGETFCAGGNITMSDEELDAIVIEMGLKGTEEILPTFFDPVIKTIRDLPIPVVVMMNGPAVGFGASLALMGDLIFAVDGAYFLQAFRHIGLVPDGAGTYLLSRMLSRPRAMELTLLGERLEARKALDWGLINGVFDRASFAEECASKIKTLASGPFSLGLIRRAIWDGLDNDILEQLRLEARLQHQATLSKDFAEGVAAFKERRPVAFVGG
jgi:2-(1,2-epoxy-1,2-dihydrophenyl)acetyl-CoA isomerase